MTDVAVRIGPQGGTVRAESRAWRADARAPRQGAAAVSHEQSARASAGRGEVGVTSSVTVGGEPYLGPYVAEALFSDQTFPTRRRVMSDDFSVRAINYTEAPNESGGITVTIGG